MVCLPFPTFLNSATSSPDALSLSAVGRARIHPQADDSSYQEIVSKCMQQSQVPEDTKENKKLRKKYMKQSVQLASDFLSLQLKLDVSVVDVEIVLTAKHMVDSDGCLACCFLDAGCQYVVVQVEGGEEGLNQAMEAIKINRLPRERIVLDYQLPPSQQFVEEVTDVSSQVGTICVKMSEGCCGDLLQKISTWEQKTKLLVEVPNDTVQSKNLNEFVASVSKSMGEDKGSIALVDPTAEQLGLAYAACMKTDREDGLFSTVVCTRSNEALGLVYSSKESIVAALKCGRGVYYSRSRNGLWRKGDTSGHYQTLHRLDVDCDGDALRFTVTQNGDVKAFCHLNTLTCWGEPRGIPHLEATLQKRLVDAPAGSYTKRLFEDETLLRDKLVEEAQELSEPGSKQEVAGELADVLYFAMVRAAKAGVSFDDAVIELDRRAKKVTRRQGDSKAFRIEAGKEILAKKS